MPTLIPTFANSPHALIMRSGNKKTWVPANIGQLRKAGFKVERNPARTDILFVEGTPSHEGLQRALGHSNFMVSQAKRAAA